MAPIHNERTGVAITAATARCAAIGGSEGLPRSRWLESGSDKQHRRPAQHGNDQTRQNDRAGASMLAVAVAGAVPVRS